MTVRLTLICHAPTAATRAARFPVDEPIDAGGADALARVASILGAGRLLTGPERRTRETAAALGSDAEVDRGLRDQEVGRWSGRSLADLAGAEPEGLAAWMADPGSAPHGGESLLGLLARVEAWMAVRAAAGGRAVAVTHPAWVRAGVVAALGAGPESFWRIEAPPLATTLFDHDGRRWTLSGLVVPP